ncbi:glycosyltransferase [Peribacillus aracenensis]|uniref:glycosyltransferase n=1 Tax=Peribacillus aracenensis TaxID=2976708 RepID=UPI0021A5D39F|nr:glycosyltransferase [Peribacillus sp. BBB004]
MNIPIIVVAYNRDLSLKRLLNSLARAEYGNQKVDLIISIDKSQNEKVSEVARDFIWKYGEKTVIEHKENLGLKKHVLKCGDFAIDRDAIIMLEDDLYVSESFYKFATQAVNFYEEDNDIAGISLYTYRVTDFADQRTFTPLQDQNDVFFMNVPSSWGQIWTKNQWKSFKKWYEENKYELIDYRNLLPEQVLNWGDSSWKKFFYMYITSEKKYIVYPRIALSTNMGESGTHNVVNSTTYQSLLMGGFTRDYIFVDVNESKTKYDSFFESENIVSLLNDQVTIDYYGLKQKFIKTGYLLTTAKLNYKIVRKWSLSLVPYELNIINNIEGNDIFLYDLSKKTEGNKKVKKISTQTIKYELPGITKKKALNITYTEYYAAFIRRMNKMLKK